jgi:hypothetical protein
MKLEKILFTILIAMAAVTLITMLIPEVEGSGGIPHPRYESMRHGGSGIERHGHLIWLHWTFGALAISFFVALMAFGARKGDSLRGFGRKLALGLAAFLAAWTFLVVAYRDYMLEATHKLYFGFPLPTAIMLYVLFPVSMVYVFFYLFGFEQWVLSNQDYTAYERLLAEKRASQNNHTDRSSGEEQPQGRVS